MSDTHRMKRPGRDLHPWSDYAMQNVIRRALKNGWSHVPTWDEALIQTRQMTDQELLRRRGIGPAMLRWVRSQVTEDSLDNP